MESIDARFLQTNAGGKPVDAKPWHKFYQYEDLR